MEGIETQAELAIVREIGADAAQGYRFGRPGPIQQVLSALG